MWTPTPQRERGKFPLFCFFNFLLGLGYSFGFTSSAALLVSQFGASSLFPVYLACSLGALAVALLFYSLIDRGNRRLVFYASFFIPALMVLGTWFYLRHDPGREFSYQTVRTLYYVAYRLTELEFWYIASLTFSNVEAKRRFSMLIAMGILGDLVGGILVSLTSHRFHAVNLPLVWGAVLLLGPFLLARISFRSRILPGMNSSIVLNQDAAGDRAGAYLKEPTTLLLMIFWIFYAFINCGIDFIFNDFAVKRLPGADDLTAYLGRFTAAASLLVLGYHSLIGSRLFERFGLRASILVMSALFAITCGLVSIHPMLATAAIGKGAVDYFIENLAIARLNTVLTTYPSSLRGRIRIFCEGFGRPLGTLLLLAFAWMWHFQPQTALLSQTLFAATIIFLLAYPYGFHRVYTEYLVAKLQSRDFGVLANSVQALGDPTKKRAVRPLIALLKSHSSLSLREIVLHSLGGIGGKEAFLEIRSWLERRVDERLQKAAIEAIGKYRNYETLFAVFRLIRTGGEVSFKIRMHALRMLARLMGRTIIPTLIQGLHDPDQRVQADLIEALGILRDRKVVPVLEPFLNHPNHRIRANTAVALFRISRSRDLVHDRARSVIESLLKSEHRHELHAGLFAVGIMGLKEFESSILALKETVDKELRHFVLCALAGLQNLIFVDPFIELLLDGNLELATRTAKRIDQFPPRSRELVMDKILSLEPGRKSRIEARLIDAAVEFIDERSLFAEARDSALNTTKI